MDVPEHGLDPLIYDQVRDCRHPTGRSGPRTSQNTDLTLSSTTKSVIADIQPMEAAHGRPRTRTSSSGRDQVRDCGHPADGSGPRTSQNTDFILPAMAKSVILDV